MLPALLVADALVARLRARVDAWDLDDEGAAAGGGGMTAFSGSSLQQPPPLLSVSVRPPGVLQPGQRVVPVIAEPTGPTLQRSLFHDREAPCFSESHLE